MGKIIWTDADLGREIQSLSVGGVLLMAPGTSESDYTFFIDGEELSKDIDFKNGEFSFKWTGRYPIRDVSLVFLKTPAYEGDSKADIDFAEILDWADGINRYPVPCQRYNMVSAETEEGPVEYDGVECLNLSMNANKTCSPCKDANLTIVNINDETEWSTDGDYVTVDQGGLYVRIYDGASWGDWEVFSRTNNATIPIADSVEPETDTDVQVKVCAPYGCFCGGNRSVGIGVQYVFTD